MKIGDKLPAIAFEATNGLTQKLTDYHGKWLVLYFYPKDSTPGCTIEGQRFRDAYAEFQSLNADIFGISRDSLPSHTRFKCKQNFPFELISDNEETLCKLFDVLHMKSFFGKQIHGIQRSTFLIDPNGILCHEWRKVSVLSHAQDVLSVLKALQKPTT
jgi:peroxiredoxin Q/BCP